MKEQFMCSVCLDVLTDPVSTPCGHNFCRTCLTHYWDNTPRCLCPLCKETFTRRPELKINTTLREVVDHFKKKSSLDKPDTQLGKTQSEVQKMIQDRLKKIKEIKHSLELGKKSTEKEIADSIEVFTALIRAIERSQAELLQVMEEKQKAAERRAEGLIKDLEQEITDLKRRDTELEQLSHTEDHLHLLQVSVPLSAQRQHSTSQDNTPHAECIFLLVDVTLDPDTAHPRLILCNDGKQVSYGDGIQNLPDYPKRFDRYPVVLGTEGFSSGKFYYEVQVKGKTYWDVGVARESINRKGQYTLSPQNGCWIVCLRKGNEYKACAGPTVILFLKEKPQTVGVFVDYEEGLVSFYDVEARSHIYSFTGQSFAEKIYPYFSPFTSVKGTNSAPLIISRIFKT
uniref:E3 ubiquitin-protein ligase TRIM39-like n=1 Tax=Electrophorus electricus TaxID=8005 RepID=A0A4W4EG20_ELEEL